MIISLYNHHFIYGTVILHNKYYIVSDKHRKKVVTIKIDKDEIIQYRLEEDITFQPNSMQSTGFTFLDSGMPLHDIYKKNKAFGIGFFTCIAVCGKNIHLNLNGYTIQQSREHYLRQRFFSLIELADAPFISGVGPHDFTDKLYSSSHLTISNGTLGLSSHHGIHGNNNKYVTIKDLYITNFEVGGIALNAPSYCTIENIIIDKSNTDVPVLGLWSTGAFLLPYIRELWKKQPNFTLQTKSRIHTAKSLYYELMSLYHTLAKEYLVTNEIRHELFHNEHNLPTGSVIFGILFHEKGVAVNGFPLKCSMTSYENTIRNCTISNIKLIVNETLALRNVDTPINNDDTYMSKSVYVDVVGSILQTQNAYTITNDGVYEGNLISNIQAIIAKATYNNISFTRSIKVNTIDEVVLHWIENGTKLVDTSLLYVFQGDSMHHVIKGVIGLKVDALYKSTIHNICIKNLSNESEKNLYAEDIKGIDIMNISNDKKELYDEYKKGNIKSHSKASYPKNQKNMVRCVSMACSHDVNIYNIDCLNNHSKYGNVLDIDYHKD